MPGMRRSLAACIRKISFIGSKVFLNSKKSAPTPPPQIVHSSTTPETSPSSSPTPCALSDNHNMAHDSFLSSLSNNTPETSLAPSPTHVIQPTTHTNVDQPVLAHGINKLPLEILAKILVMAVDDPRTAIIQKHGGIAPKTYFAPLVFTHVSTYWRDAATVASELWTTIAIRPSYKTLGHMLDHMSTWMYYSGESIPLSIFLNVEISQPSNALMDTILHHPYDPINDCLTLMQEHNNRWDTIGLVVPYATLTCLTQFDTTRIQLFLVRSLEDREPFPYTYVDQQAGCVRPTHIKHLYWEDLPNIFGFNNIVDLYLPNTRLRIEPAISLLSDACAHLQFLTINVQDNMPPDQSPTILQLPHLTTFRIYADSDLTITSILGCLETPMLTDITIRMSMFTFFPLSSLKGLLEQSRARIQAFGLRCQTLHPADDLLAFLASNPSLLRLDLDIYELDGRIPTITDAFFLRMARPQAHENGMLLPNLRRLTYRGPQDFRWEYVLLMCRARLRPQSYLDLIKIHINDNEDKTQINNVMDTKTRFGFLELFETRRNGTLRIILPDHHQRIGW